MRGLACPAALALLIASCAPPAPRVSIRRPMPARFDGGAMGPSAATIDWRTFFADPGLEALIAAAVTGSFDLQLALQRIEVARAMVKQATGARLPQLGVGAGAAVRKYGLYTMDGAGNATTDITPGQRVPEHLPDLGFGLQATWEPDLWRELANLHGAARARYLASMEGVHLVVTSVVNEIAVTYVHLVALDRTLEVLARTIEHQEEALEMMRVQKDVGRTNELAVQQFAGQLASTRALDAITRQQIRELENHLNLLVGRPPQPVARSGELLDRPVPPFLATGVPSDLMRNRPDIRQAERTVEAARLDVAAARAAFYPRLTISASVGYQAFDPRYLLRTPASIAYSLVAGVFAPLVNRRGIEAAFEAASALQVEAMVEYQRTVLTAFTEVATSLYRLQQAAEVVAQRRSKQAAISETVGTADALFRAGKASYLEVLLAQRNALDSELELIEALRDQHVARIRLYKALGGGWSQVGVKRPVAHHSGRVTVGASDRSGFAGATTDTPAP